MAYSDWWSGTFRVATHCLLGEFDSQTTGDVIKSSHRLHAGTYGSDTYSISYRYFVDAKVYTSSVVSCETFSNEVGKRLKEFPTNQAISVYYDSEFPQFAVLDRESQTFSSVFGQLFLCLVIIPSFTIFLARYVWGVGRKEIENET